MYQQLMYQQLIYQLLLYQRLIYQQLMYQRIMYRRLMYQWLMYQRLTYQRPMYQRLRGLSDFLSNSTLEFFFNICGVDAILVEGNWVTVRCYLRMQITSYPYCPYIVGHIATCYGLDSSGIESRWRRDFSHLSRMVQPPIQPPVTMGTGSFTGQKRPGRGVDQSPHPAPRLRKE